MSKNSIQVAIKVRPLLRKEKDQHTFWKVSGNSICVVDSAAEPYIFDHIFDEKASNEAVFETMAKHIVHATIKGINGTIFAYGQTSSGKTYTMMGDAENPGVTLLAIKEIFKEIGLSDRQFLLRVGYIEIYNEKVYDLLNKKNQDLKIHESANGVVVHCEEKIITSEEEMVNSLRMGDKDRTVGETAMNERSSRSHAIFRIIIESRKTDSSEEDTVIQSVLNLVDLAGSERADQTGATGARLKEGSHINKSLLFLSNVIKRLSENEDDKYISYRDSKLTRILQASLGGNAVTSIICTIKPNALEETQSTLSFALRAKTIKNKPVINEVVSDGTMLKRLTRQIRELEERLAEEQKKQSSQLHVSQLKQRLGTEFMKLITANSLNNMDAKKQQRRRTWAPSVGNNSSGTNDSNDFSTGIPIPYPASTRATKGFPLPKQFNPQHITNTFGAILPATTTDEEHFRPAEEFFQLEGTPKRSTNAASDFQTPVNTVGASLFGATDMDDANKEQLHKITETPRLSDNPILKLQCVESAFSELQEYTNLEKAIDVEHDAYKALKEQLDAVTARNIELEAERANFMARMDELQMTKKCLMESSKRYDEAAVQISRLTQVNQQNETLVKEYCNQIDELRGEVKRLEITNQELAGFDIERERNKSKFKAREDELIGAIVEKDKEIAELKKSLESIRNYQNQPPVEKIVIKPADYEKEFCVNCQDLEKLREENRRVQEAFEKLQKDYEKALEEAVMAQNELKVLTDSNREKEQAFDNLKSRTSTLQGKLDSVYEEYRKVKEENDRKGENLKALEGSLNEQAEKMRILLEKCKTLEKEHLRLNSLQDSYDEISRKYAKLQNDYGKLDEQSQKSEEDCQRLHQENERLQAEIGKLKDDIKMTQKQMEEFSSQDAEAESIATLKAKVDALKVELAELRSEYDRLQKENDDLSDKLIENCEDSDLLRRQLEEAQKKCQENEQKCHVAEEKHKEMNDEVIVLRSQLEGLLLRPSRCASVGIVSDLGSTDSLRSSGMGFDHDQAGSHSSPEMPEKFIHRKNLVAERESDDDEMYQLKSKIAELSKQNDHLLREKQSIMETAERDINSMKEQLERLTHELMEKSVMLDCLEKEKHELTIQNHDLSRHKDFAEQLANNTLPSDCGEKACDNCLSWEKKLEECKEKQSEDISKYIQIIKAKDNEILDHIARTETNEESFRATYNEAKAAWAKAEQEQRMQIANLEKRVLQYSNDYDHQCKEFLHLKEEYEFAKTKLEGENSKLEKTIAELKASLDGECAKCLEGGDIEKYKDLEEQLSRGKAIQNQLEQEVQKLKEDNQRLKSQINFDINKLETENGNLKKTVGELQSTLSTERHNNLEESAKWKETLQALEKGIEQTEGLKAELVETKAVKDQLEQEVLKLREGIKSSKNEMESLKEVNAGIYEQLKDLQQNKGEMMKKIQSLEQMYRSEEDKAHELEQSKAQLIEQIQRLQHLEKIEQEQELMRNDLSKAKETITELEGQKVEYVKQLEVAMEKLSEKSQELEEIRKEKSELKEDEENRLSRLKEELETLAKENQALRDISVAAQSLKCHVEKDRERMHALIKELEQKSGLIETLVYKGKKSLQNTIEMLLEKGEGLTVLAQFINHLTVALEELAKEKDAVHDQAETLQLKGISMKQELDEVKERMWQLEEKNRSLQAEILADAGRNNDNVAELTAELSTLRTKVLDAERTEMAVAAIMDSQKAQIKILEQNLKEAKDATQEQGQFVLKLKSEHEKSLRDLDIERCALQKKLQEMESSMQEMQLKCHSLEKANREMQQNKLQFEWKLAEAVKAADKCESMERDLKSSKAEIQVLKEQLEEETRSIKKLQGQLKLKDSCLDNLLHEKKALEDKLKATESAIQKLAESNEANRQSNLSSLESSSSSIASPGKRRSGEQLFSEHHQMHNINVDVNDLLTAKLHKHLAQEAVDRRNRRTSIHDQRRLETSWIDTRNVSTMTDPTDSNCNCVELDKQLQKCRKELFIRESQVTVMEMERRSNPLKQENVQLLKRFEEEQIKHGREIKRLQDIIVENNSNAQKQVDVIKRLREQIQSLDNNLSTMQDQVKTEIEARARLQEKLKVESQMLAETEVKLKAEAQLRAKLEVQLQTERKAQTAAEELLKNKALTEMTDRISALTEKLKVESALLAQAKSRCTKLEVQLQAEDKARLVAGAKVKEHDTALGEMAERINVLTENLKAESALLAENKAKCAKLEHQLQDESKARLVAEAAVNDKEKALSDMVDRLNVLTKNVKEKSELLGQSEAKINKLELQLQRAGSTPLFEENLKVEAEDLAKYKALVERETQTDAQIDDFMQQYQKLRGKYEDIKNICRDRYRRIQELQRRLNGEQEEEDLEYYKVCLHQSQKECKILQQKIEIANKALEARKEELISLRARNEELENLIKFKT